MKIVSTKNILEKNSELFIKPKKLFSFSKIRIISSSNYRIENSQNKVIDFGPIRVGKNYAKAKVINVNDMDIKITLIYYGIPTFEFADEKFYFGIELLNEFDEVIADSYDFDFYLNIYHKNESCKFSFQRAFVERYDTSLNEYKKLEICPFDNIKLLSDAYQVCKYKEITPELILENEFTHFKNVLPRNYLSFPCFKDINKYNIDHLFIDEIKKGYKAKQYVFKNNYTGLIRLNIKTNKINKIFVIFDEYLIDNEFVFGRGNVSNLIEIVIDKGGQYLFSSNVSYTLKHLLILSKEEIEISPSLVSIQNDLVNEIPLVNDEKADEVIKAARRTFMQNSFDVFTDCPSRERAGWLCDSYFSGLCEKFYLNSNNIEKTFLENIILSNESYLPKGMVPMCYPSNYVNDKTFIPNWALWFIVEIHRYVLETHDEALAKLAKDKIYDILHYFAKFENEFHFLQNLESWVFIEWSDATSDDYLKGINFPTNMLYAGALSCASALYDDISLAKKASIIKENINKYSYNGNFYVDNGEIVEGKIKLFEDHISEVCQYYALFFNISSDDNLSKKMIKVDPSLSPCAVFIGKFLRLIWLYKIKQYELIKKEYVDYFYFMAKETGTLWEKYIPDASCNHGFASCLGMYLYNIYKGEH